MELVRPKVVAEEHFARIKAVSRIQDAIKIAQTLGDPVHVVSAPGYGKTTAFYYLTQELKGTYCNIGAAGKSVPNMYKTLLASFRIAHDCRHTIDLYDILISNLGNRPWLSSQEQEKQLLIVDEIQTLDPTAQRELLNVQETCNLALIIAGNGERIADNKSKRAMMQVDDRIGAVIKLPNLDKTDCELMGSAYGVEGMDAFRLIIDYGTRTNARRLGRLLQAAKAMTAGAGCIQIHHLQSVLKAGLNITSP